MFCICFYLCKPCPEYPVLSYELFFFLCSETNDLKLFLSLVLIWYKVVLCVFLSCVLWSGRSYFGTNRLTVNIHLLSFAVSRQVTKCLLLLKLLRNCVPSEFLHILDVIIYVIFYEFGA